MYSLPVQLSANCDIDLVMSLNFNGLLTTRLVTSSKQRPVDVAQVVCSLVQVHGLWRLTEPDSFFHLSESLIILPVSYFCPFLIQVMVSRGDMCFYYTPDIRSIWGYIIFAFPFVRLFVRTYVCLSFRHRVKVFAFKLLGMIPTLDVTEVKVTNIEFSYKSKKICV